MSVIPSRLRGFVRSFSQFEPFQCGKWEAVLLRLLFAWLASSLILTAPPSFPDTPHPHGLAHFMDLGFLRNATTVHWLSLTATLTLALRALGIAEPLTLGWTLFVVVASKSYNQSQGVIGHAGQLLTLCLLAQWLASVWALRKSAAGLHGLIWGGLESWKRQVWWITQTIAASYTVSACTKLINSDFTWPFRGAHFLVQILNAHEENRASYLGEPSQFAQWIVRLLTDHPTLGNAMLIPAFALEFFAFLALLNRRLSLALGLDLLAFHNMTDLNMAIDFGAHQQLLWLFLVNPIFWAGAAILLVRSRFRPQA